MLLRHLWLWRIHISVGRWFIDTSTIGRLLRRIREVHHLCSSSTTTTTTTTCRTLNRTAIWRSDRIWQISCVRRLETHVTEISRNSKNVVIDWCTATITTTTRTTAMTAITTSASTFASTSTRISTAGISAATATMTATATVTVMVVVVTVVTTMW